MVMTSASKNSFQASVKEKMAEATRPGAESGSDPHSTSLTPAAFAAVINSLSSVASDNWNRCRQWLHPQNTTAGWPRRQSQTTPSVFMAFVDEVLNVEIT